MEQEHYTLNIENCIADRTRPAVIRNLFIDLRERGYVTVGEYFETMADADLNSLRDIAEIVASNDEPQTAEEEDAFSNIVLLSCGLIIAEGNEVDPAEFSMAVRMTMTFISLESLARMGAIDVYRENWCMDPDHKGIIAKAKN